MRLGEDGHGDGLVLADEGQSVTFRVARGRHQAPWLGLLSVQLLIASTSPVTGKGLHELKSLVSAKFGTMKYVRITTLNIVTKWKLDDDIMNGD